MSFNIDKLWYGKHPLSWFLWPFAQFYKIIIKIRRTWLRCFHQQQFSVPVIVVGNLTVGGVGKTPLVVALAKEMKARGLRVGIVSRGYKAKIKQFPHEVFPESKADLVGDEPLLIAKNTRCPVVIAPRRVQAIRYLLEKHDCQIIISDDGLQHYSMGRALEIIVIDGVRGMGNGFCLPAGPLREERHRLQQADILVVNGGEWPGAYSMNLEPGRLTHLLTGETISKDEFKVPVAAVAAIGNPQRFFSTLHNLGISFKKYPFPDHYQFQANELRFNEKTVVMTEKDAVKCQSFADESWYFLPVEAKLSNSFWQMLWSHEQLKGYI
ncbi:MULTISPECIES: tetraacyldisaccharide 4'-kinase [unclassified Legionella]|uniref:tetraacyldisaccharide 4'-kinase n=1 Tax=unclassified Legionella TaxID=2622702 RepID=UPI001055F058|nr:MULTISPECIES: tetraacyldisaccharide 4'-kinase [unclassified Legionella]MDI9819383.1 tetraacyldisaccharide 4'-kinase [Legionella sp. PL877]